MESFTTSFDDDYSLEYDDQGNRVEVHAGYRLREIEPEPEPDYASLPFAYPYDPDLPEFREVSDFMSPNEIRANLKHRVEVLQWAINDPVRQEIVKILCKKDYLWFFNTMLQVLETRLATETPFITWQLQDNLAKAVFDTIDDSIDVFSRKTLGVDKSRDLGGTYTILACYFHRLMFFDRQILGVVSREREMVDATGDKTGTLFWKLKFFYEHLPTWMQFSQGKSTRMMIMNNFDRGSAIIGSGPVKNMFRGDRLLSLFFDEASAFDGSKAELAKAAIGPATGSVIYLSTPLGRDRFFYPIMHDPSPKIRHVHLRWEDHPSRKRGLYRVDEGIATDTNPLSPLTGEQRQNLPSIWRALRNKGFHINGTVRSPYYDEMCLDPEASPTYIAQEFDRDYGMSGGRFITDAQIDGIKHLVRAPHRRVAIDCRTDAEGLNIELEVEEDQANFDLWVPLRHDMRPPENTHYALGCDISMGTGGDRTSNSTIVVLNKFNGEQVGSFASNTINPTDFADLAVRVARWFNDALLNFERNGPGVAFCNRVIDLGYPYLYYQEVESVVKKQKKKNPGFHYSNKAVKNAFLQETRRGLLTQSLIARDPNLYHEFTEFVYWKDGAIVHQRSVDTDDGANAGEAHGDRMIGLAMAWMALKDVKEPFRDFEALPPPRDSLAYRMEQAEKEDSLAIKRRKWVKSTVSQW